MRLLWCNTHYNGNRHIQNNKQFMKVMTMMHVYNKCIASLRLCMYIDHTLQEFWASCGNNLPSLLLHFELERHGFWKLFMFWLSKCRVTKAPIQGTKNALNLLTLPTSHFKNDAKQLEEKKMNYKRYKTLNKLLSANLNRNVTVLQCGLK